MKRLFLILSLLVSLGIKSQVDSSAVESDSTEVTEFDQFKTYKVCMTCSDQWKSGGSLPENNYQSRTINENNAARQTVSNSKRLVNGIILTVVGVVVVSATYALTTKTQNSVNELINP